MSDLAVTDTHALIWASTGVVRKLGTRARKFFERVDAGQAALYVPTVAFVEMAEAVQAGRVQLAIPFTQWMQAVLDTKRYLAAELTVEIVSRAEALYAIPERNDRLIAATALVLGVPLITRDPKIAAVIGEDHIW